MNMSLFVEMLQQFESMWDGPLGWIKAIQPQIELDKPKELPINLPHTAPALKPEISRNRKSIRCSPWTLWNLPRPNEYHQSCSGKKDGTLRICIDYPKLKAVTIWDWYPILRMGKCSGSLRDPTIFSTLDADSEYWQVKVAQEDCNKTASTSHQGLFCFTRMPFGLERAPGTFKRTINVLLMEGKWQFALFYLDNIVNFSRAPEKPIKPRLTRADVIKRCRIDSVLNKCE